MKIRMILTLDVDAEAWADEYGLDPTEARDDIRTYVQSALTSLAAPIRAVVLR